MTLEWVRASRPLPCWTPKWTPNDCLSLPSHSELSLRGCGKAWSRRNLDDAALLDARQHRSDRDQCRRRCMSTAHRWIVRPRDGTPRAPTKWRRRTRPAARPSRHRQGRHTPGGVSEALSALARCERAGSQPVMREHVEEEPSAKPHCRRFGALGRATLQHVASLRSDLRRPSGVDAGRQHAPSSRAADWVASLSRR